MKILNRSAIILKYKKPFINWVNLNGREKFTTAEINSESQIYLIDKYDNEEQLTKILKRHYRYCFKNELSSWNPDKTRLPKVITWKSFNEWFDIKVVSLISDLGTEPIITK